MCLHCIHLFEQLGVDRLLKHNLVLEFGVFLHDLLYLLERHYFLLKSLIELCVDFVVQVGQVHDKRRSSLLIVSCLKLEGLVELAETVDALVTDNIEDVVGNLFPSGLLEEFLEHPVAEDG